MIDCCTSTTEKMLEYRTVFKDGVTAVKDLLCRKYPLWRNYLP